MKQVAFIGFGNIGQAIAKIISPHANIRAWDTNRSKIPKNGSEDIQTVLLDAEVIFLCTPSWTIRSIAEQIRPMISPTCAIICLAKGLEQETLKTMPEVLEDVCSPLQPIGILGGPLLSDELMNSMHGIGALGSSHPDVHAAADELFTGSTVRLEHLSDARTIALLAVLKNIYTVGLGIADGLQWGHNATGWLCGLALQEMQTIIHRIGGDPSLILSPAGAGDFLATCMSPHSRNRKSGQEIARTNTCVQPSEGCRSTIPMRALLKNQTSSLPFFEAIDQIVNRQNNPQQTFQALFKSPLT